MKGKKIMVKDMKLSKTEQAELEACSSFLVGKIGKEAVDSLMSAGHQVVISTARKLKVDFDNLNVCNTAIRLRDVLTEIGTAFRPDFQALVEEFSPSVQGIKTEGKASWSRQGSRKLQDGSNMTLTLRAINPEYDSEGAKLARASENTVQERLARILDGKLRSSIELVKFERGTKEKGTKQVAVYKKPISYQGLNWQLYLGDMPEVEETAE